MVESASGLRRRGRLIALITPLFLVATATAQTTGWPPSEMTIAPLTPGPEDEITIILSGLWRNSCVPNDSVITVEGNRILFDVIEDRPVNTQCAQAISPWQRSETVDPLGSGVFFVYARFSRGAVSGSTDPTYVGTITTIPCGLTDFQFPAFLLLSLVILKMSFTKRCVRRRNCPQHVS